MNKLAPGTPPEGQGLPGDSDGAMDMMADGRAMGLDSGSAGYQGAG